MKVEYRIYMGIGVFVLLITAVYFFWAKEYGGVTMLFGVAGLGIMPALYFGWWRKRMDPRPEDSETATIAESKGVIGAFPSNTIWPFVLGMGAFLSALSLVFGEWTLVIGGALLIFGAASVTLESRRGGVI
ncbi:MAG: cytochrome c oxidase subunit 4 [Actinomycetota bacterium]|nr:cytochrome c oxidase subunit 4 [Actinomycetota bacterium]